MQQDRVLSHLAVVVPLCFVLVFVLYPLADVILDGLLYGPGQNLLSVLSSPITQRTVGFTVAQAAVSTLLSLAVGVPGALLLTRLHFRGKSYVRAAVVVPFVLPPIVVVVGFLRMFGSLGILDSLAMYLTGSQESVINLATGIIGIVLAHTFYNVPLVVLMVSAALERLPPDVEESAEILGATGIQKMRTIILPHIMPALLSSALLVFLFCFMSFPIVLALGGSSYMTIEVQMWNAFKTFDYGETSSLALLQVCITLALAYTYSIASKTGRGQATQTSSLRTRGLEELTIRERILSMVYLLILGVLVAGPVVAIFQASIYDPVTDAYSPSGFVNLLNPAVGGGLTPMLNSLFYSTIATMLSITLALPMAYARKRKTARTSTLTSTLILFPLGVSSITLAYGLLRVIAVPLGWNQNPWPIIVIAQTIIGLPFTTRAIEISLSHVDSDYLNQADLLGASRFERLFLVEIPLIAPGIVAGGIFAFAMAIGEMSATLFVALPQNVTLAVAVYQYLAVRKFVQAGASSLVIALACFIAFLVMEKLMRGSSGGVLGWSE